MCQQTVTDGGRYCGGHARRFVGNGRGVGTVSDQERKPIVSINIYREEKQKKDAARQDSWQNLDDRIAALDEQIENYKQAIDNAEEALQAMEDELKEELARRKGKSPE